MTGHYLTNDWVLNCNILSTRQVSERYTGTNIAIEVNKIIQEFQVPSLSAITTDNAGNMNFAARELNIFQVTCFAHTLQLAIEDGL